MKEVGGGRQEASSESNECTELISNQVNATGSGGGIPRGNGEYTKAYLGTRFCLGMISNSGSCWKFKWQC